MRVIGELSDSDQAGTFSDYLTQAGIDNRVDEETSAGQRVYEIWVLSEDDVSRAEVELKKFRENPGGEEYQGVARAAKKIKKQAEKEAKEPPLYMDARTTVFYQGPTPNGALTLILILACLAIAVFSKLGENTRALQKLFIVDLFNQGDYVYWNKGLKEIMRGEVWRLFTPMFIHFGIMHLVFNMLWLKDLGSMIEDRKGSLFLGVFVLVVSAASNLTQFMVSHPLFGGMSGVVYGMLGYIWMKGKFDPVSRLSLHKSTVALMIFWFFFCFTGLAGRVANGAHAAGLIVGMAWGYLTSGMIRQHLRKLLEKGK